MLFIISNTIAQGKIDNPKKFNLISISSGADIANKNNFTPFVKMPLKGLNGGLSFDKYWNWYGVGIDAYYYLNNAPQYIETDFNSKLGGPSPGGLFSPGFKMVVSKTNSKLTRAFTGIGPSFKYQTANNKIMAELNLRGGLTYTNGSSLNMATSSVPFPILNKTVFTHIGYSKDWIKTGKAQIRINYFITPKIGVNIGAYYNNYWGSKALYSYADMKTAPAYWAIPMTKGLSALSSFGATAGLSYKIGKAKKAIQVNEIKAENALTILVKDELTGQGIANATITVHNIENKDFSVMTGPDGQSILRNLTSGYYTVKGTLNGIATTQQNVNLEKVVANSSVTLIHNDPRFTVQGKAINLTKNKPEGGVSVTLKNAAKGSVKLATSESYNGQFGFQLEPESDYSLVGKKASYISNIENISTKGLIRSQTLYVELQLGVEEVEKGKSILLNKIYYDYNKSNITEEASSDLQKLIQFLVDNPTFNVEIASHTDSRGNDDYNMKLSQERAESVVKYLNHKGISSNRMIAKGYGETKLINNCSNGVNCSEAQHQENRRTEFKVISN